MKKDLLIQVILYSPHVCDFIWQRPDGTCYSDRRDHGQKYLEAIKDGDKWVFGKEIHPSQTNHS